MTELQKDQTDLSLSTTLNIKEAINHNGLCWEQTGTMQVANLSIFRCSHYMTMMPTCFCLLKTNPSLLVHPSAERPRGLFNLPLRYVQENNNQDMHALK